MCSSNTLLADPRPETSNWREELTLYEANLRLSDSVTVVARLRPRQTNFSYVIGLLRSALRLVPCSWTLFGRYWTQIGPRFDHLPDHLPKSREHWSEA